MDRTEHLLYLTADVELSIEVHEANLQHTYSVVGPSLALGCVHRESAVEGDGLSSAIGKLSPQHKVTLPAAARRDAGIPEDADHYCFLYPLSCLAGKWDALVSEYAVHAQSQWLDALLLGAFVYFSKAGSVLRINALSLKPSTARLRLDGPLKGSAQAFSELESQSRVQSVTLSHLLETGLQRMAWAMPREAPGGAPLSEESGVDWPSGAMVYEQRVLAEGGSSNSTQIVFFRVVPGGGSAGAIGDVFKASSEHSGGNRRLSFSSALASMQAATREAEIEQQKLASEIEELMRPPFMRWLREYGLALLLYYLISSILLVHIEGWRPLDAVYALTATSTGVGYGDFAPVTPVGRICAIFLSLAGSVLVVGATLQLVAPLIEMMNAKTSTLMNKMERMTGIDMDGDGRLGEVHKPSRLTPYFQVLPGPFVSMLALALVCYLVMGENILDSLYFAAITMTTVGFGDITPSGWGGKLALVLLMPVSTATLAYALKDAAKIAKCAEIREQNFKLLLKSYMQRVAANAKIGGDPDVALSKSDFLVAMLKEFDLVDTTTIQAIEEQFDQLVSINKSSQAAAGTSASGQTDGEGEDRMLDCRTVYAHLVKQRRVLHRGNERLEAPRGATSSLVKSSMRRPPSLKRTKTWQAIDQKAVRGLSPSGSRPGQPGAARQRTIPSVDMSTPDRGFQEWYELYWVPSVLKRVSVEQSWAAAELSYGPEQVKWMA